MLSMSYLAVTLAVSLTLTFADPVTTTPVPESTKAAAKELVQTVRQVVDQAKNGMYLEPLRQDILDIQSAASDLIKLLPGEAAECDLKSIIKMAAAATGSHEVLTVLVAEDDLNVLNGRLSLSLAILEHVAQQLEDELALSSAVSPHLAALVFGTNVTVSIIDTADKTVKAASTIINSENGINVIDKHNRIRRRLPSIGFGDSGWSLSTRGLRWRSPTGRYTFNIRPTFIGIRPDGFRANFTIVF